MRLTPLEPEIPEIGGFTSENDIFGYHDFAERLTNLVRNIEEPLVIALDGPWGSGKSVFTKQWAGLLRERGAAVIQFDAFANDHYDDAFLAISAQIYASASKKLGGGSGLTRRYLNKAKKVGTVLAPIAARIAARVGTAGLLSLDDLEAGNDAAKEAIKALGSESAKALENVISDRITKASEERDALVVFQEVLSELATTLSEDIIEEGDPFPLVFIIDELDRCRPPFALSIIEAIKHLFSVQGVCFVLVTHIPQLELSVKGAYGADIDASTYLEKFFQLRVTLPDKKGERSEPISEYLVYLWKALGISFSDSKHNRPVLGELKRLAVAHHLSLRRLERVMTHLVLVSAAAAQNQLIIPPIVAGLCVMRQTHTQIYEKARAGQLTWSEAEDFLKPIQLDGEHKDWVLNWWKFCLGEELPEQTHHSISHSLVSYNIFEENRILPIMTAYIDSLVQQVETSGRL